jgi:hypothetical protein
MATAAERRRSYRAFLEEGCARCSTDSSVGLYAVRDLSIGGARLEGEALPVGTRLRLMLLLPGQAPVVAEGTVLRLDAATGVGVQLAVAFGGLGPDGEDTIEEAIVAQMVRERGPVVVVADSADGEARALARGLRAMGCCVIHVATPLELICQLQRGERRIDTVLLGPHLGSSHGLEVAAFLADAYPHLRRVLVARGGWRRSQRAAGLVHAVIRKPWSQRQLEDALRPATN